MPVPDLPLPPSSLSLSDLFVAPIASLFYFGSRYLGFLAV